MPLVYEELRDSRIFMRQRSNLRATTALVNELTCGSRLKHEMGYRALFRDCGQAMRRILVDHARALMTANEVRFDRTSRNDLVPCTTPIDDAGVARYALTRLAAISPRQAR